MTDSLRALSTVRGQPGAVRLLRELSDAGGLIPPLLLHGPEGCGKRTAALAFAARLVCRRRSGGDACGSCGPCSRVAGAAAVTDLRSSSTGQDSPRAYPDAGLISRAGRRTRISVLQARDIALSLATHPFELPYRIYIVDPADQLTPAAANALLKTLEEPPPYAVLLLLATAPWRLPTTVRSRLRPVRFRPLDAEDVAAILVEEGTDPDEARTRARLSNGSCTRARQLDPDEERQRVERWVDLLASLGDRRRAPALAVAAGQEMSADRDDARRGLTLLLEILRDVAVVERGGPARLLTEEQVGRLAAHATALVGPWLEGPRLVDGLAREIEIFNRNPRLSVEGAVLALAGRLDRDTLVTG